MGEINYIGSRRDDTVGEIKDIGRRKRRYRGRNKGYRTKKETIQDGEIKDRGQRNKG